MSQLDGAVSRYNKLLESGPYRDLGWAEALHQRMETGNLSSGGRLICPFLRPNFISRRQYENLVKTGESLIAAIDRLEQMVLSSPVLLSRLELLPAEKMLASIDPGYQALEVASRLDSHMVNGHLHFVQYNADSPTGAGYADALAELFYDQPPVKEFRKRYTLTRTGSRKHLLHALLKSFKQFGGAAKKPNIAILEFRAPYHSGQSEYELFRDYFRQEGYQVEIVSPEQLEYRAGVLRRGPFEINLVYRRLGVQEFLIRFDLTHPLVQAYRDRAVCVVNSFRSELAHKKAMFGLLTDENFTAKFPANERKAIREHVPWTRLVAAAKTTYEDKTIDLPEFITSNRERLTLKPNDDYSDQHTYFGWEMDASGWERALKQAMRTPYVVQERVEPVRSVFPLMSFGHLEFKEMQVDIHPHAYLGKVQGCSSWLSTGKSGFSSASGIVPTFIIDPK
ncbi:MAG TPA: hypothetical protein VMH28_22945 [Candidatus Acidoferrales bacterium]|nr:hypothetical protein [Candidatus Acidoferrales bacterium]